MRVLIAEDDAVSRRLLRSNLTEWGYQVVETEDGQAAWDCFQSEDAPSLAVLDWMMPGLDGVEVCRRVRELGPSVRPYLLLLTAKGEKADIVTGLDAGADDYVVKPFDRQELRARVRVGARLIEALSRVRRLEGIIPICSYCKKIRDDANCWQKIESYICSHTDASFTHGICPECFEQVSKDLNLGKQGRRAVSEEV